MNVLFLNTEQTMENIFAYKKLYSQNFCSLVIFDRVELYLTSKTTLQMKIYQAFLKSRLLKGFLKLRIIKIY